MKIIHIIFGLSLMALLSYCGSGQDESAYEELLHTSDSLSKRNTNLKAAHDTIVQAHQQLHGRLQALDSLDSTWLKNMARHEVILKNHEVLLNKNTELFQVHENFKNNRDQLSSNEFQAQMAELKEDHSEVKSQLDQIEAEQGTLNEQHQSIRDGIKEKRTEKQPQ